MEGRKEKKKSVKINKKHMDYITYPKEIKPDAIKQCKGSGYT